jgi:hypothetical protein
MSSEEANKVEVESEITKLEATLEEDSDDDRTADELDTTKSVTSVEKEKSEVESEATSEVTKMPAKKRKRVNDDDDDTGDDDDLKNESGDNMNFASIRKKKMKRRSG